MPELRHLRAACVRKIEGIPVPRPFDLELFTKSVSAHRGGRPIKIFPVSGLARDGVPYGLWAGLDNEDLIIIEQATSPLHRDVIALHELGHMLCGHDPAVFLDPELLQQAFPDLKQAAFTHLFATRQDYSSEQEREAEMVASLLMERAGLGQTRPGGANSISRLGEALSHPLRGERRV
jgi:hypothetical protein